MQACLLFVDFQFFHIRSLKDRRNQLRRLKHMLRTRFELSVAEVGPQNSRPLARLGLLYWAPDPDAARSRAEDMLEALASGLDGEVTGHQLERMG